MSTLRVTAQPACVLHVRPWRETSLLLECLSRDHGRVGLLARGTRSARGRLRRALLEPFQDLELDFSGRGELRSLARAEPAAPPRRFTGDALYAGLYLNELLVRLLPRDDAQPGLLARYRAALDALAADDEVGWTLRRFERDLLAALGYALELGREGDSGLPLEPETEYVYVPEHGPQRWTGQGGLRLRGADLLALADDRRPDAAAGQRLRRLLRQLIRWHLPGTDLRSWAMLAGSGRRAAPFSPAPEKPCGPA